MKDSIKFKIFLPLIIFITSSCILNYKSLPGGGIRPNNPDFDLADSATTLTDMTLIDTNAIYLKKVDNIGPKGETYYSFLRFFSNGKVYASQGYNFYPTNTEINNFNEGDIGYFLIENDEIVIELFSHPRLVFLFLPGASYVKYYYKFQNSNTLKLYAVDKFYFNFIPHKSEIDYNNNQPDVYKKVKDKNFLFLAEPEC